MQIWLTILVSWPEPRRTHQPDHAGIGIDHRLGAFEDGLLAADHDGQLAVFGAGLAARDRRVEEIEAAGLAASWQFDARPRPMRWCCR